MNTNPTPTTMLGLGEMGGVLAATLIGAGYPTTVWNRSPARAEPLAARGAAAPGNVADAISASPLIVACLFDHASVRETLDPVTSNLRGRTLVNLTTTTPNEARELADWADRNEIDYLDGGIMATPPMIGGPGSTVLYSGSATAFEEHRPLLDLWGRSAYFGADAGMASLYDLAILSGMYVMFAGFMQGAAMVASEGVPASEFVAWSQPFLAAMTESLPRMAAIIDARDYTGEGQQSLEFSDLTMFITACAEQGVSDEVIRPVHEMVQRQIAAGHGSEGVDRIFEELRNTR